MAELTIMRVTKIEVTSSYPANDSQKTVRFTSTDWQGNESHIDLTVYGNTEALGALPLAEGFHVYTPSNLEAAE